jgi:hypothetical protein
MIQANELRIGNFVEYRCYDELATPKEEWVLNPIDIDDLIYLFETPNPTDYRPIPLTKEWMRKFKFPSNDPILLYNSDGDAVYLSDFDHIKYLHQLQNLYHSLTGEELTLNP